MIASLLIIPRNTGEDGLGLSQISRPEYFGLSSKHLGHWEEESLHKIARPDVISGKLMQGSFLREVFPEVVVGGKVIQLPDSLIFYLLPDVLHQFFEFKGSHVIEGFDSQAGMIIGLAGRCNARINVIFVLKPLHPFFLFRRHGIRGVHTESEV